MNPSCEQFVRRSNRIRIGLSVAKRWIEAVAKAKELYPDLIILDLAMPRMDGLKAASEIHRLIPSIPIVIHTLYQSALDLTTAEKYGVRKVVDKTEAGGLFSTVKELLREEVQSQSTVPHETSET